MKLPLKNKDIKVEIDDEDFKIVGGLNWYLIRSGRNGVGRYAGWYFLDRDGKYSILLMHRLLAGLHHGDHRVVDHRDRNGLNNRKENIRICEQKENMRNRKRATSNKSGFKGVYKQGNRWRAEIRFEKKKYCIGSYSSPKEAHEAYKKHALKFHGEFARFS